MERLSETPLAVIGMACRLPGAPDLDAFWRLLIEGRSAVAEVPPERLDQELYYTPERGVLGKTYSKLAALVDTEPFDARRCPVPGRLIASADVGQWTICQVAADACRDAGMDPFAMPARNTGVFVGHTYGGRLGSDLVYATCLEMVADYLREVDAFTRLGAEVTQAVPREVVEQMRAGLPRRRRDGLPGVSAHLAAAMISESLELSGPSMVLDAACSSSLQGLAVAGRALLRGRIDMALVGGASYCSQDGMILFSQAQSISGSGSFPFDAKADGLIAGEGYVILVVKTLRRALADGDPIRCVIRGIGVSSDGRGKSLWAPRKEGQVEAIRRAYGPGVDMARLQFVEAHATSTQAGDIVEMTALAEVLGEQLPPGTKIPVGGVKANIGHTLETAGLAGVVKTILALQRGIIPKQIHCDTLNPAIPWSEAPYFLPTENREWPRHDDGHPRRAAVNAFGIGGLNVHVVLDEYDERARSAGFFPSLPQEKAEIASSGPKAISPPDGEAVAIVGMGCIFPGARTLEAFWDLLVSGRDPKCDVPPDRWNAALSYDPDAPRPFHSTSKRGGFITDFEYDWRRHRVPPKQIAGADPLQFMILDATDAALRDAGFDQRPFDRMRTAVVVGTIFGSDFSNQLQVGLRLPDFRRALVDVMRRHKIAEDRIEAVADAYAKVLLEHMPALKDETGSFTPSTLASRITKSFDLFGGGVSVNAGQTSSLAAILSAADWLLTGDCDLVVCAAGNRGMGLPVYEQLSLLGGLAKGDPKAPFDAQADGCVPGEGVGVLLLKRLSDARRDGDRIRGVLRGFGAGFSRSRTESMRQAMARALDNSEAKPEDVALLEAAALGIPKYDRKELEAVIQTYGKHARRGPLRLGSLAAQLGYLRGSLGMASLIKAVLAMEHGQLPGTFGLDASAAWVSDHKALVATDAQSTVLPEPAPEERLLAGMSSADPSGSSYHVLVERGVKVAVDEKPSTPLTTARDTQHDAEPSWRIVRVGAESQEELARRVALLAKRPEASFASVEAVSGFTARDRFRMAVVARDPAELAGGARLAAEHAHQPRLRAMLQQKGVFLGEVAQGRPLVAFLFPGQGSQYPGMLRSLVRGVPAAAAAMERLDEVLVRLNFPRFAELTWNDAESLGADPWRTQLALLAADMILDASVRALGVKPDRVGGHSYGEYPALVAAGAWTFETAARATRIRCEAIEQCAEARGGMLSSTAPADVVERLCREVEGDVFVANRNAPDQTVAAGQTESLARLDQRLRQEGFDTRALAVPRPFHTPLMAGVQAPLLAGLARLDLDPPEAPLLSSVTNRYAADPDEIRANLVAQMTEPVRYRDMIQRLADEGIGVFLEIGPGRVLTGLHQRILADRSAPLMATNDRKMEDMRWWRCVEACLETAGALGPVPEEAESENAPARVRSIPSPRAEEQTPPVLSEGFAENGLTVLKLEGSPYEMGLAHGRAQRDQIRTILRRYADVAGLAWDKLREVDTSPAQVNVFFGPEELEELQGIADGAEAALPGVIGHNLQLYPDSGGGCIHFAVRARGNTDTGLLHGANEDLPLGLTVRSCLTRNIQIRRPAGKIPHVTFAVSGQPGGATGINAKGLAVSSATLLDHPQEPLPARGKLHGVIIKRLLEDAEEIEAAVEIVRANPGHGAWGLCLSHHPTDRVCYLEYDGRSVHVRPDIPAILAANHSLLRASATPPPAHSRNRLKRLRDLFGGEQPDRLDPARARAALRDRYDLARGRKTRHPTMNTIRRVDNQISVVMQPASHEVWVTSGPGTRGQEETFHHLKLDAMFDQSRMQEKQESRAPRRSTPVGVASPADSPAPAEDAPESICRRFVMHMEEAPPVGNTAVFSGTALIVGQNAVGRALGRRIEGQGGTAVELPLSGEPGEVLAHVERLWETSPMTHLFLVTPHDEDAELSLDAESWQHRRRRGVLLPYFICQAWYQRIAAADMLDRAAVVAATTLGGDFGLGANVRNAESGAMVGLVKGLGLEAEQIADGKLLAKVVDTSPDLAPEEAAALVLRESTAGDREKEVGYPGNQRHVMRPTHVPAATLPAVEPARGGTWVVTGGARGITAVVARELGRRFQLKLHLIGSSPAPDVDPAWHDLSQDALRALRAEVTKKAVARGEVPIQAWKRIEKAMEIDRNLRALEAAGVRATYHACDVSDRAALAKTLEAVRAADGPIHGIVHGAGVEQACRFEKKQRESVLRTVSAKVDGAAALLELTRDDPLSHCIAFGSTSGRFGGVGQTDYCLANEMLAKLMDWYRARNPACKTTTIQWHGWGEVGMAARPETKHSPLLRVLRFMSTREGLRHLTDELEAGLPVGEVLITEWAYCRNFHPSLPEFPPEPAARPAAAASVPKRPRAKVPETEGLPLLDAVRELVPGKRLVAELRLHPTEDVFLREHRFRDRPMMPVVMGMEALAEAALLVGGRDKAVVGLRDVRAGDALQFFSEEEISARLHAEATREGIRCRLTSDLVNRQGKLVQKDRLHLSATLDVAAPRGPLDLPPPWLPESWHEVEYPDDLPVIYHGPVFRALRQASVDQSGGWGRLVAPRPEEIAGERPCRGLLLPAAVLDACFFACGICVWLGNGEVAIPQGVKRLRLGRLPRAGEACLARFQRWRAAEGHGLFDFWLFGEDDTALAHVECYESRVVGGGKA